MQSWVVRAILITTFMLAIGIIVVSFWIFGFGKAEIWNTTAASLAVITALISAWMSQTLFEKQKEAQQPNPYPIIDFNSRPGLILLRLTNMGGSIAYDINLIWDKPLLNKNGIEARFSERKPEVPLLRPNQSIAVLIDSAVNFLSKNKDAEYSGAVEFKDNPRSNKIFRHNFYMSVEMYRGLLKYTSLEQETQDKLKRIPDEIGRIATELEELRTDLRKVEVETESENNL